MEQKLLTDLKVGDTIYRIVEKRKHTHKDIKIDELEVTCADIKNNYLTIKSGDETLIDWAIEGLADCESILDYDADENCIYYGTSRESVINIFNRSIDSDIAYYEKKLDEQIKHFKSVIEELKLQKLSL